MTEVVREVYQALEQLRQTLQQVHISQQVKEQFDQLLTPLFANESSCQRITDIVNEIGDFSENILVPLLEQYVSANIAVRVRFLVEDLLVYVENYRDEILKKIEKENKTQQEERRQNGEQNQATMGRLALNSATNHYRMALHGSEKADPRAKMKLKTRSESVVRLNKNQSHSINASFRVVDKVKEQNEFKARRAASKTEENPTMVALTWSKSEGKVVSSPNAVPPTLLKSGQVLIKVLAVGLNHSDYAKYAGANAHRGSMFRRNSASSDNDDPPHVSQLKELSKSILNMGRSSVNNASVSPMGSVTAPPRGRLSAQIQNSRTLFPETNGSKSIFGQEFCGVVKDIAWQRGDFLHRLHVARDDIVFGILRQTDDNSSGCLGEYVVCEVNDVAKCPRRLGNDPMRAARLPLDGSAVVRTLAATDITNPRGTQALVIGASSNAGQILIELLTKDLKVPMNNIHALIPRNHFDTMTRGGLIERNLRDIDSEQESWLGSFGNSSLDVIFDCRSESDSQTKINFSKLLEGKMRRSAQFMTVDSPKMALEKKSRSNEDYQREFSLLSDLVEKRKLAFDMFQDNNVLEFTEAAVNDAVAAMRSGGVIGKPVVELSEASVTALKDNNN